MERHILTILIYVPQDKGDLDGTDKEVVESPERLFRTQRRFNLTWTMESECNAEAGDMAVSGT